MATKYKIAVNNTQPQQTQATNQIVQQLAQNAANQQLQNQAQAQAEAIDPMRQTVNDLLKNKLLNTVEMPRFTTVQDILDAPKGSKLETFGKFLGNNPDITRLIGTLAGGTYMDKNGNFVNAGEQTARRQEALMQADQQKALAQQKEQNDIATALNSAFLQQDIANMNDKRMRELAKEEIEFKKQENALNRALQREQLNATIAHQRAMEGIARERLNGGSATGGAASVGGGLNLNNIKMTAAERKSLTENKTTLANIESGLKALEENPNAYQWYKGILGADVANRIDPKGVGTRTQIDNITAVYRKWLTGAQMSDKERKAYERFLPAPTDNYNIVKAKLEGMRGAVQRSNDAILSNYGISNSGPNISKKDSLGLGI